MGRESLVAYSKGTRQPSTEMVLGLPAKPLCRLAGNVAVLFGSGSAGNTLVVQMDPQSIVRFMHEARVQFVSATLS